LWFPASFGDTVEAAFFTPTLRFAFFAGTAFVCSFDAFFMWCLSVSAFSKKSWSYRVSSVSLWFEESFGDTVEAAFFTPALRFAFFAGAAFVCSFDAFFMSSPRN
jgi:hypothetical protein